MQVSSPRKRGTISSKRKWIPAFAGMTNLDLVRVFPGEWWKSFHTPGKAESPGRNSKTGQCMTLHCVMRHVTFPVVIKSFRHKGIERLFRKGDARDVQAQHTCLLYTSPSPRD